MQRIPDLDDLRRAIAHGWSSETSSKWRLDNPALGQCSVTALVAQEIAGGAILKTAVGSAWHFYNEIDGRRIDFSESQFDGPIVYDDLATDREEAFADTSARQHETLLRRVRLTLARDPSTDGLRPNRK
ncbi:hypothetical protein LXM94_19305 [Rhizobium sp. TRM95111]|uniref:YunG family protein n=1 Tax=Rhizobium alarense TaxID=2846851 RepID=UPI001F4435F4|nr:hypothetical protein [Rhizobium alarense]MCF3642119.1 hypothetical protein [Rhizobium alarense]